MRAVPPVPSLPLVLARLAPAPGFRPGRGAASQGLQRTRPIRAIAALAAANLIWGGSVVASEALLVHLPPLTLAGLRVGVGWVVLRALLQLSGGRPATGRAPALLGLTGMALFCALQNLGLGTAGVGTSALLNGAIPVLTAPLAAAFLGERLGGRRLAGLLLSLGGIVILVLGGSGATPGLAALGNLLPLMSAASFAVFTVLGRGVLAGGAGGNTLAIVTGSTGYGVLFLLPGALIEAAITGIGPVTPQDALLIVYLGAGCSALAFLLCGYGLARIEAGRGAARGNLKPLVGLGLAVVLLGEPVSATQLGGGVLVLLGVALASRRGDPAVG